MLLIEYFSIKLLKKVLRNFFPSIYYDFWRENLDNLHRVSPGNFFQQKF